MIPGLPALRERLLATHHVGRIHLMLDLGRQAREDAAALALVDALAAGEVFERRLALFAQHTLLDGKRLLPFTGDASRSLRDMAFVLVPRACDDGQALEALQAAFALRRDKGLLRRLSAAGRATVIDRYLDWLAARPGLTDFAAILPMASPEGVRRHLARALGQPSQVFWERMARLAPDALGEALVARVRAVAGEPDAVTRQLVEAHTGTLARRAPDQALALIELLLARGIKSQVGKLGVLGAQRPLATLALIERFDVRGAGAPFASNPGALDQEALVRVVRRDPWMLGGAAYLPMLLSEEKLAAVVTAWCEVAETHPVWGLPLIGRVADAGFRTRAWERWSVAARDMEGVTPLESVAVLPEALREREARRHLHEVVALATRPERRIEYARLLPWDEAEAAVRQLLGHPEGTARGLALSVMLSIPRRRPAETALADRALAMVVARKNEQDPVRLTMLRTLAAWPRAVWRPEHTRAIGQILRDALDAGDLSHASAHAAEGLLLRTFRLDPGWASGWLGTFIKERGTVYDARLGAHLTDDEVRVLAPHLLAVARTWAASERIQDVISLAESMGDRLTLVSGMPELVEELVRKSVWEHFALSLMVILARFDRPRYEAALAESRSRWLDKGWQGAVLALAARPEKRGHRQPPLRPELTAAVEQIARGRGTDGEVVRAVTVLRVRAAPRFDAILPELLARDPSYVCIGVVHWHLHKRRQELLGPFLGNQVITGRFASGETAWLLPFAKGFYRWTPEQNTTFARSLASIIGDRERDTPTVWRCTAVLAAMDSAPMDALAALASDEREAVKERAIRVMARCDQGQCLPTLIGCLADARARIAIYGLRRAVMDMPPARALAVLAEAPLTKVTVAKEVLRLLGELRTEAAYDRLLALDAENLHRDVRIALLRALWDHLDREPTWAVLERAVSGPDAVMASRLGDIPADKLTVASDRRLSALLGKLLDRPEPEARIDLLARAAQLSVSDPDRAFLSACAQRLISPYDDEVRAAAAAILHRSTEADLDRLPGLLAVAMDDPRCLHVAVAALTSVPVKSRASWVGALRAAESVLARDPRWIALRVRCAAAAMDAPELADRVAVLGEADALSSDALEACRAAVDALPVGQLAATVDRLGASTSPEVRRLAVRALARDAGPDRGWSPERLARLAELQRDPSPIVSGAAWAVFPPREMTAGRGFAGRPGTDEETRQHRGA